MLVYEQIDVSDGVDINNSKECSFCHYWYYLDKDFTYGPYLCDGCDNRMQTSIDFKNIAIVHIKKSAHIIYFLDMTKREAKKLMANSYLTDKKGLLSKILFYFFIIYKVDNTTYYQRNREKLLNRAKDYYQNDKERLREQARNKYRNLSEEDKEKKRQYGKNRYHNMSEEKKQELKEYHK